MQDAIGDRSTGGSQDLRLKRNVRPRKIQKEKDEDALAHIIKSLGQEEANNIRMTYSSLESSGKTLNSDDWGISNGIIATLIGQNYAYNSIRMLLGCGMSKIQRVKRDIENPNRLMANRHAPWHAATEEDLNRIKSCKRTWELEDGFPCAHRRPREYFVEENVTWKSLHAMYAANLNEMGYRVISLSRWRQYVHYFFPGLRLSKSTEDVCDACVTIDIQLLAPDLTDAEIADLTLKKSIHLEAAKSQRRMMNDFVKSFTDAHSPGQSILNPLPEEIVEDLPVIFDSPDEITLKLPKVTVQAQDFGGSLTMPHYGYRRPSADYFNSNLIIHNFVIADITGGVNNIYFYDERAQGKDGNALCNLRIAYHLTKSEITTVSLDILDNFVGQNKSNTTMMFCAMLSILFYETVVCIYLIPGHSHMVADRVVAWMKKSIRSKQIFHPDEFVKSCNDIKSVKAVFLDHTVRNSHFFIGWDGLLGKYFKKLPTGFTQNYFFEFENGTVTYRHLSSSPDSEAVHFPMCYTSNLDILKHSLAMELFGAADRSLWSMDQIKLPKHQGITLQAAKLSSLSKKYFSIPLTRLGYYPNVPEDLQVDEDEIPPGSRSHKKARIEKFMCPNKELAGIKKPGRPKKAYKLPDGCQAIFNFFK